MEAKVFTSGNLGNDANIHLIMGKIDHRTIKIFNKQMKDYLREEET